MPTKSPKRAKPTDAKAQAPVAEWLEKPVTITLVNPSGSKTVRCKCHGHFGVRQQISEGQAIWPLTHLPSGLVVCRLKWEADAKRVGEYLQARFGKVFSLADSKKIRPALPDWVLVWLNNMSREGVWREPPDNC